MNKQVQNQSISEKLRLLYQLQTIHSKIDEIKILRGELPLQVKDLEDDIKGFEKRITNVKDEMAGIKKIISEKRNGIKESESLIKKYRKQQMSVRNNRQFDSLNKEIEYESLDIELSKKRIKEFRAKHDVIRKRIQNIKEHINDKKADLEDKQKELNTIVNETVKEEETLSDRTIGIAQNIEEHLLTTYERIRNNVKNGLAVAVIDREACGGCFNKIPPQRKLDIATRNKIIVCEHCGRILVDALIDKDDEQLVIDGI